MTKLVSYCHFRLIMNELSEPDTLTLPPRPPFTRAPLGFIDLIVGQLGSDGVAYSNEIIPIAASCPGRREIEPLVGFDMVQRNTLASVIKQAQQVLSANVPLLGSAMIPDRCQAIVLRNTLSGLVHVAEIGPIRGVALFGRTHDRSCADIDNPIGANCAVLHWRSSRRAGSDKHSNRGATYD
jgi:hypothetical protein